MAHEVELSDATRYEEWNRIRRILFPCAQHKRYESLQWGFRTEHGTPYGRVVAAWYTSTGLCDVDYTPEMG